MGLPGKAKLKCYLMWKSAILIAEESVSLVERWVRPEHVQLVWGRGFCFNVLHSFIHSFSSEGTTTIVSILLIQKVRDRSWRPCKGWALNHCVGLATQGQSISSAWTRLGIARPLEFHFLFHSPLSFPTFKGGKFGLRTHLHRPGAYILVKDTHREQDK